MNPELKAVAMNPKEENWLLAGVQVLFLLVCLGGVIFDFSSGLIFNIDGLLLLMISASLAAVFAFALFLQARSEGWLEKLPLPWRKKGASDAGSQGTSQPSAPGGKQ